MKRLRPLILVPEINPMNLVLFWLISFVMRVEAYSIQRMCPGILNRKIRLIDLDKYVPGTDGIRFKSSAVRLWEGLLERFPEDRWILQFGGHRLDFSTKAKQDLASQFEILILLQQVRKQNEANARVYIIDSPRIRYLKKLDSSADYFNYPSIAGISLVNVVLSLAFDLLYSIAQMCRLIQSMLYTCLPSTDRRSRTSAPIPFLWDAVGANELTLDADRRSFSWIIDDDQILPENILFVLPKGTNKRIMGERRFSGKWAFTLQETYRLIPIGILLSTVVYLPVFMAKNLLRLHSGLPTIQMSDYFLAVMKFKPITDHFKPRCYINNLSHLGQEEPVIIYLGALNVPTVMCCYSGNAHDFSDNLESNDFKSVRFAHILASRMVVWNEDYKKYIMEHSQNALTIDVIGPLMVGNEDVFQSPQEVIRSNSGVRLNGKGSGKRYISLFDVSTLSKEYKIAARIYGDPYTEEYATSFLRDMMRLLKDYEDIVLVFKPKRNLRGNNFPHNSEFHELLTDLEKSERGLILDDDINPWIPVALADLCVAMPFTSPPLAAMHYGIPGLFHDPTGIALHHRYREVDHLITHDYDQLRSQVTLLAHDSPRYNGGKEVVWGQAHSFIGGYPGTNSSDRFRQILHEIAMQET